MLYKPTEFEEDTFFCHGSGFPLDASTVKSLGQYQEDNLALAYLSLQVLMTMCNQHISSKTSGNASCLAFRFQYSRPTFGYFLRGFMRV